METYYTLLDIPVEATPDDVARAYARQRERYDPARVAGLDDEFRQVAEARCVDLERAYAVLSDPARRRAYDRSLGIAAPDESPRSQRAGLSRREVGMALGGALVGLLAIGLVWALAGRSAAPPLPGVGETRRPAPGFELPGLDGSTVRLSDYRGKVVLVNFWGTWCEPCREETPALQAAYQRLRDEGLVIVGVDLRNQERPGPAGDADVRAFVERYAVSYPIALDLDGATARAFQVLPLPTSFFVDPSGTIRYVRVSTLSAADVEALFRRLRQEQEAASLP